MRDFRAWIAEHKDELTALQLLYAGTKPLRLSLNDLRQLKDALASTAAWGRRTPCSAINSSL